VNWRIGELANWRIGELVNWWIREWVNLHRAATAALPEHAR